MTDANSLRASASNRSAEYSALIPDARSLADSGSYPGTLAQRDSNVDISHGALQHGLDPKALDEKLRTFLKYADAIHVDLVMDSATLAGRGVTLMLVPKLQQDAADKPGAFADLPECKTMRWQPSNKIATDLAAVWFIWDKVLLCKGFEDKTKREEMVAVNVEEDRFQWDSACNE